MTGPALRVVANGLENSRSARAVLLVFPDQKAPQDWDLYDWPKRAHELIGELLDPGGGSERAKVSLQWQRGEGPQSATLRNPFSNKNVPVDKIQDFWRRALNWDVNAANDMLKAWTDPNGPDSRRTLLPFPAAEAGLLLPLERARAGLTMLAPEDSPLHVRPPMRPTVGSLSAIGRPWLGKPDTLVRLASADPSVANIASPQALSGPPDVASWLRDRNSGVDVSDHPYSAYLDGDAITRTALGRDKEDLLWLFDRMHALHYAALNGVEWIADAGADQDDFELACCNTAAAAIVVFAGFDAAVRLCAGCLPRFCNGSSSKRPWNICRGEG